MGSVLVIELKKTLIQGVNWLCGGLSRRFNGAFGLLPKRDNRALNVRVRKRDFDFFQVRRLNTLPAACSADEAVDLPSESIRSEQKLYVTRNGYLWPDAVNQELLLLRRAVPE